MQVTDETGDACTRVQQASYCQQRGDQEQNSACGRRVIDRGIASADANMAATYQSISKGVATRTDKPICSQRRR